MILGKFRLVLTLRDGDLSILELYWVNNHRLLNYLQTKPVRLNNNNCLGEEILSRLAHKGPGGDRGNRFSHMLPRSHSQAVLDILACINSLGERRLSYFLQK